MSKLWIIGTCHWDMNCAGRLESVLNKISPTVILSEGSEAEELDYLTKLEILEEELVERYGKTPVVNYFMGMEKRCSPEIDVSKKYAETNKIKFDWLEKKKPKPRSQIRRNCLRTVNSGLFLLPLGEVKKLFRAYQPEIEKDFSRLNGFTLKQEKAWADQQISGDRNDPRCLRDIQMESTIRRYWCRESKEVIVAVVGASHACYDSKGNGLYSRIQELKPKRIILNQ